MNIVEFLSMSPVPQHLPRKLHAISQSKHTDTSVYNSKNSRHLPCPHKDSPVFKCRVPHTLSQVVNTLTRDISGSHNALLTGLDCGQLHTYILFIYHPSYFHISSPFKCKFSIYIIWIGSSESSWWPQKEQRNESQKGINFPLFYSSLPSDHLIGK